MYIPLNSTGLGEHEGKSPLFFDLVVGSITPPIPAQLHFLEVLQELPCTVCALVPRVAVNCFVGSSQP